MTTQEVCEVIERETGKAVTLDTPLESLETDSLEFLNLLVVLQDEGGKQILDERLDHLKTVGDIAAELA